MPAHKYITTFLLLFFCVHNASAWIFSGHTKYLHTDLQHDPESFEAMSGLETTSTNALELRLLADEQVNNTHITLHYTIDQLSSNHGIDNTLIPDDSTSLFDLTHTISDDTNTVSWHRLDRLTIGYSTDNLVTRFGRQAVTWGNGFVFNTMDIFNPFKPTALDREFKPGDDMLYLQWLLDSGDDVQLIILPRRDSSNHELESSLSSAAIKSKHIFDFADIDLLYAEHYDEQILVTGFTRTILESLWRTDISTTRLENGHYITSLVTNLDYSWVWLNHNVYGFIEYFYNGFGDTDTVLLTNTALLNRIVRGELFTAYRNHLIGGLQIELHPLFQLSPTLILNTDDSSALFSLGINYNWKQNLTLLASAEVSVGDDTSEYGGAFSPGDSLNLVLSYYF